jgi:hypothetical protein
MPAPVLLMDNDALLKAAHWDLLDIVPALVGCTWAETACLPQFPPRVSRAEAKLFADTSVAEALAARLALRSPLPEPDVRILGALQSRPGIDAGELLLVGALAATPGARLLTGDKRALAALAKTDALPTCGERFLCVEQLLWLGLDQLGPEQLIQRVRRWSFRDEAIRAIVGRDREKSTDELREGLKSYVRSLDHDAPGLLARGFGL